MKKKKKKPLIYTRLLRPEAIIYALKENKFIHSQAISLLTIQQLNDEIQITYTIV